MLIRNKKLIKNNFSIYKKYITHIKISLIELFNHLYIKVIHLNLYLEFSKINN